MKQFFDLRLGYLVERPGQESPLESIEFKAGDGEEVILQFGRSPDDSSSLSVVETPVWTVESLAAGGTITIGIKEEGDFSDGDLLASQSTFAYDGTAETYTFELDFNTTEINNLLNRGDSHDNNDIASLLLAGYEITFKNGAAAKPRSSVKQVTATIHHDIIYGDEGTPTNAGDPDEYALTVDTIKFLKDVVGPTGDGATKLDGVLTASLSAGFAVEFIDDSASSIHRVYELVAATTAESSPDVIRPGDYAASTNEKVWLLRNASGGGGTSLPVTDTTAIVKDPSDATKLLGLDAGAIATGQTRFIQSPDGDSRIRSSIPFWAFTPTESVSAATVDLGYFPTDFVVESIFYANSTPGSSDFVEVQLRSNGNNLHSATDINSAASHGGGKTVLVSALTSPHDVLSSGVHLDVIVSDDGSGSAGTAAQGLLIWLIGYHALV